MKKFSTMMLTLFMLTSCTTNGTHSNKPKEFILDSGATVSVNGKEIKSDTDGPYSLEYIVKNSSFMHIGFLKDGILQERHGRSDLGLQLDNYTTSRDIENYKFKFFGDDVIEDGKPGPFFGWVDMTFTVAVFEGKHIHPLDLKMRLDLITEDTVAYIPNSVARECKANILKALEAGDLEECYRIFREDYNYIPITGAALKKLKTDGLDDVFEK